MPGHEGLLRAEVAAELVIGAVLGRLPGTAFVVPLDFEALQQLLAVLLTAGGRNDLHPALLELQRQPLEFVEITALPVFKEQVQQSLF